MQFERSAPPLVVLGGDQAAIEPEVFGVHRLEREGQGVEMVGDGRQLARNPAGPDPLTGRPARLCRKSNIV